MAHTDADLQKADGIFELQGQQFLPLDDPDTAYIVHEGHITIYLAKIEQGKPSGPRHHLFSCHEGSTLYGTPLTLNDGDHALLGVAIESCRIERITAPARDTERFAAPDGLLDGIHNWVEHLCALLAESNRIQFAEKAEPGADFAFQDGQVFKTSGFGVRLLRLDEGTAEPVGDTELALYAESSGIIAATSDLWFRAAGERIRGSFVDFPDEAAIDGTLFAGIGNLTQLVIAHRMRLMRAAQAAELLRFEKLEALGAAEHRNTVNLLRFDRRGESLRYRPRETPLMSVLDLIGRNMGVTFKDDPMAIVRNSRDERVEAITRVSGTRARHVRLIGRWWKDDVGHLLAFKKDTGTPVALICASRWLGMQRYYEIVDGDTGEHTPITEALAEELDEVAFAFLRPLPVSEKVSYTELAKSVMAPFIPDFRLMLLLSLVTGILGAVMPYANFMMVDKVIPDANRDLMWDLAAGLAAMSVGMFLFGLSTGLLSIRMNTAMTAQLQSAIMDRLLRLPNRFFRRYPSGDLLNRAMMISEISAGFSMSAFGSLLGLLSTVVMLAMCFYYSSKLAILAVVAAIITSIFSLTFSFIIRKKALAMELASGELFSFVVQMVTGVTKLQIAGADTRALNQWARRYGDQLRESFSIAHLGHWSGLINMTIQTLATLALYYLAGTMVAETAALQAINPLTPPLITIGTFFAVQGAFGSVIGGVVAFFGTFITLHQQLAKRELVRPILEEPVEGGGVKADPGRLDGHIQLSHVNFSYIADGPKVLQDVSIKALPGEFIAIVGPSGSGKSTILKLLLGFDFPTSGQILYDKKDVAELDMLAVRRQIGVVLQDGKINAGTLYHAICGASNMSMDEAWEAAEAAGFAEDVKSFPMGMHTLLPEGASTLSGGQRQRLLIARALATRPRVVYFDEATSALDNRTQAVVTQSLKQRKVTRIVIAHRLTTIMDADRIFVLDKGGVIQSGTFDQLMAEEGLFKRMASRQLA